MVQRKSKIMTDTQDIEIWKSQIGEQKLMSMWLYFASIGCKYEYTSFDFKAAKEEYLIIHGNTVPTNPRFSDHLSYRDISKPLQLRHKVTRVGTMREIDFLKNKPIRFRIGNKYAKNFYLKDLFISVRPILTKEQDRFGLLYSNLAVISELYDKTKR